MDEMMLKKLKYNFMDNNREFIFSQINKFINAHETRIKFYVYVVKKNYPLI
jgi:hypothetical protein